MKNIFYLKTFTKLNFHKHTFCVFQEVELNMITELKLNFTSKSGSSYYYQENGVYRLSNHWSRVANCRWRINNVNVKINNNINIKNNNRVKLGFAKWTDFYPDNDFEKLYFIEINSENEVNYFHKNSSNYSNQLLRTAIETSKAIKQIRTLFDQTAWTKHLNDQNCEDVRMKIIAQLINTNKSFQEIRRNYL